MPPGGAWRTFAKANVPPTVATARRSLPRKKPLLRLLALLYSLPRPPKPDDKTLAEHPFADLEDFEEFVDVPPFAIGNPNYPPEERGLSELEACSLSARRRKE